MDGSKINVGQIVRIARKQSNQHLMWVREMDALIGKLAFVSEIISPGKDDERFKCRIISQNTDIRPFQYLSSSLDAPCQAPQLSINGYAQIKDTDFFAEYEIDLDYWEPHKKAFLVKELNEETALLENWGIQDFDEIFEAPTNLLTPLPPIQSAAIFVNSYEFAFIETYSHGCSCLFLPKEMVTKITYPDVLVPCLNKDVPVYQEWALSARAKVPFALVGTGINSVKYYTNRAGEIFSSNIMPFENAPAECNNFWWRANNEL